MSILVLRARAKEQKKMNEQKARTIARLQEDIQKLQDKIKQVETLPDELNVSQMSAWEQLISISIPFDIAKIREVRRILGADWEAKGKPSLNDQNGDLIIHYARKDDPKVELILFAEPYRTGSTCRRIKSGTKTVDTYKIVCDGGKDGTD